ncbi:MAG TPA: DNA-3-methyladenine glycosylase [Acidobacteriota bacterium]|nr:DNA-3-methyladenine glycosylase [Acidobacteriota bacterium]
MTKRPTTRRLSRRFFRRDAATLARALLGQRLVSTVGGVRTAGAVVETEAYLGVHDKAAHTYGGRRSARNATMWGHGGHAYVYFVYGMHHCVNAVAGSAEEPMAVLIRALQPDEGLSEMYTRRQRAHDDTDLCSGPAKLCQALGITRRLDGVDLTGPGELCIERRLDRPLPETSVSVGPRVGIGYAEEWQGKPLRFFVRGNPHVSRG